MVAEADSVDDLWERLFINETATSEAPWDLDATDSIPLAHRLGCFVDNVRVDGLSHEQGRRLDRATKLFVNAIAQALEEAGGIPRGRGGIFVGRACADLAIYAGDIVANTLTGRRPHPLTIPRVMPNSTAAAVAQHYGLHGPAITVSTACSSSADAIATACRALACGELDWAITGGTDCLVESPHTFSAFQGLGVMSAAQRPRSASRPFDATRDGLVMGEGAAALLLVATGDGDRPVILGSASTTDAHHLVAPEPDGTHALASMKNAITAAGLQMADVDAISTHGTGTRLNDEIEGNLYLTHFPDTPLTASKAVTGHLMGASPAVEIIIAVEMLRRGTVPPTANLTSPDPIGTKVSSTGCKVEMNFVLSNSFAFGGHNTTLLLGLV